MPLTLLEIRNQELETGLGGLVEQGAGGVAQSGPAFDNVQIYRLDKI